MLSRNIPLLAVAQAIGISGSATVVLLGGIIGTNLAPTPALATVPITLTVIGLALMTIPASLLMRRIGRRRGFMTAALVAMAAALLAAYGVFLESFLVFCLATLIIGSSNAFVQQYRFAASESVPPEYVSRAISIVLLGGILAGFVGPEIAKRTQDLIPAGLYLGSFVSIAILYAIAALLFLFFREVSQKEEETRGENRPLRAIVTQPLFVIAVLAGAVSYGTMTLIMTATPIHMNHNHGFTLADTTFVIQSHIIAMYLPSLFSGILIARLGLFRVMLVGVGLLFSVAVFAIAGSSLANFWAALVMLGIGWNFLFVGGTVLLTQTYFPAERFKSQAVNDFTVFGTQAVASLSSGTMLFLASWNILILFSLPFLFLILLVILIMRQRILAVT
ncbi:MAG: MFS transporter [Anaerolineales bacterium]|nr:MFS transporter [Anaerolineales bacterium]